MSRPFAAAHRLPLLALLGLLGPPLAGCGGAVDYTYDPLDRAAHPHADAVVLLDEGRLSYSDGRERGYVFERHVRLKVLTPRGRARADIAVPLDGFSTLTALEGYSFGPSTHDLERLPPAAMSSAPARPGAGVLFADGRFAQATVPGVDVGDIVDYRYRVFSKRLFALPDWVFEWEIPVVRSRLMVAERSDAPARWSCVRRGRVEAFEPTRSRDGDGDWLVFERRDVPAFEPEPYGPPLAEQVARLRLRFESVAETGSWAAVAGWYRDLMTPRLALPEAVATQAKAATEGMAPAERLAWVDDFVRDRIRYVATHVGIGAFQPHAVQAVLASGHGDCKDMVTLYIALGRALDLDVRPVLVGTRGNGVLDPELPTVSAFDHVIAAVRVGESWVYADPTDSEGAPGHLLPAVAGRPGLRVDADDGALIDLPAATPGDERVELSWTFDAGDRVRVEARFAGLSARPWRAAPDDAEARAAIARGAFFEGDPAAVVEAVEITGEGAAARVVVDGRWPGLWTALDAGVEGLPLHRFVGGSAEIRVPAERDSAIDLGQPRSRVVRLDLPWTGGIEAVSPGVGVEETALGASRWTVEAADGRLRMAHELRIDTPRVEADGLAALRALMEHAARVGRGMVVRAAPEGGAS